MKKWCLFLSAYALVCALAGCGGELAAPAEPETRPPEGASAVSSAQVEEETVLRGRVIDGAREGDAVLLAGGEEAPGVYTLTLPEGAQVQNGDLVEISFGGEMTDSFPAGLGGVTAVEAVPGGMDDLCVLYLQVLEDLWEVDSGLNGGISMIGMDLSATSLTPSEQQAVSWLFAQRHGMELVEGSWQELCDQGYIDQENLWWEDGCHFSITESPLEGTYSLQPLAFDAQKWRSGLGAYYFCDCTSVRSALGHWDEYTVGAHAIS